MPTKQLYTLAFYNLENLFDTVDDRYILDDDFTPSGTKKWTEKRLQKKLGKLGKTIAAIGHDETQMPPVLVGIAEVENNKIIERLLRTKDLGDLPYDYVHFDSPDERGIDTGLLYHTDHFKVITAETLPLIISDSDGERDLTRDMLYVHGSLNDEELHIFVNHWPSRREGEAETRYKRIAAANTLLQKINSLPAEAPLNLIIMGDFNDNPNAESIKTLTDSGLLINPMQQLLSPQKGSANYKGKWSLFDQILLSHSLLNYAPKTHSFTKADIFAPQFLREWKGRYRGNPFRTFIGKRYAGGYSDHFPVYVILKSN